MAIYTIRQFADEIGKEPKHVHSYIARKKLIKNGDKKIDTSELINDAFLKKYSQKLAAKTILKHETPINSDESDEKEIPKLKDTNEYSQLELQEKQLRIEKLRREVDLKNEELRKKKGESIDLNPALTIVKTYSVKLKKELANGVQILIQDICAREGVDPGRAGEYKLKVNDIINSSNKTSIEELLKQFTDGT